MICIICHGTRKAAGSPDGNCWYCKGLGVIDTDEYTVRHHRHSAKLASSDAAKLQHLRQTMGRGEAPALQAIKG